MARNCALKPGRPENQHLGRSDGAGSHGNHEVSGWGSAYIRHPVFFVGVDEAHVAGRQLELFAVHGDFDIAFADEPHLGVYVVVGGMQRGAGGKSGLVDLKRLSGCKLALRISRT